MARTITVIPPTINPLTRVPATSIEKRKVAAYARVSTDSEEQLTSYEAQIDYYTKYINQNREWQFVKVYTDEGITATNTKRRDGFNEMVTDALAGKIDLIVTKSVSRFARNTVDSLTTVRELKAHGVEVYFEKENIYTFDGKGELLITIMSSLAQEESRSISENVTWGQRKRFADGKVTMPFKHFLGYDRGEDGVPVINEKEAEVVRLIYSLFLHGKTAVGICRHLESLNIPTPSGKSKWRQSTVMSILKNEKYKGDALLQKKFTVDFLTKKQKVNEGEVPQYYVEGSHPAIISVIDFDMVQSEITRRQGLGRSYSGTSIFSSKLICGNCGGFYGKKVWHSTDAYRREIWRCNNKFSSETKCDTPTLDIDTIKQLFLKAYNRLMGNREQLIKSCEAMRSIINDCEELDAEIESLNEEIQVVTELVNQCVKENATTEQSQGEYERKYNRLVARYEKAIARLNEVTAERESRNQRDRNIRIFISALKEKPLVIEAFDEELWICLLESATVYPDSKVVFRFKSGTEITEQLQEFS